MSLSPKPGVKRKCIYVKQLLLQSLSLGLSGILVGSWPLGMGRGQVSMAVSSGLSPPVRCSFTPGSRPGSFCHEFFWRRDQSPLTKITSSGCQQHDPTEAGKGLAGGPLGRPVNATGRSQANSQAS